MENLTNQALSEIKNGAKFNGKLYKADKKGVYKTAYIDNVKYNIYYLDIDEFLEKASNLQGKKDGTFGTGCITTDAKAHKFGFDAIEN